MGSGDAALEQLEPQVVVLKRADLVVESAHSQCLLAAKDRRWEAEEIALAQESLEQIWRIGVAE